MFRVGNSYDLSSLARCIHTARVPFFQWLSRARFCLTSLPGIVLDLLQQHMVYTNETKNFKSDMYFWV